MPLGRGSVAGGKFWLCLTTAIMDSASMGGMQRARSVCVSLSAFSFDLQCLSGE